VTQPRPDVRRRLGRPAPGESLGERLVRCLPAASFEMETLVGLASVEESREVPSAAVTCEGRPRLLFNPDFIAEHCQSDEHLFLLAMHELWHVILAHTRLYPRATLAENVAFDAVINAGLAREFRAPEYRGFFEAINPADAFPGLLLRPPLGWPSEPRYAVPGPKGTAWLLERLYPPPRKDTDMPTYGEILALIEKAAKQEEPAPSESGEPAEGSLHEPFLLGDHEDPEGEERVMEDPVFGEIVREMVASWPPPPIPIQGRDSGRAPGSWTEALERPGKATRRAFAAVLRRVLVRGSAAAARRERRVVSLPGGFGPLPNPADRTVHARQALGLPTLLREQSVATPVRVREVTASAHVYLDVSGSMFGLLPWLTGLLVPHVLAGRARVFQFSNVVEPIGLQALRAGSFTTTGGTDLHCVYQHWLEHPSARRALIVTDGYVGSPRPHLARDAAKCRLRLHAVLPSESAWRNDLQPLAASITVLPPLQGAPDTRRRTR
jgi:hypothetical protein